MGLKLFQVLAGQLCDGGRWPACRHALHRIHPLPQLQGLKLSTPAPGMAWL
jgi:hypothetical protein